MRVVLSNFLPVRQARRLYEEGTYPSQYLFGAVALEEAGHEVSYAQPGDGRLRPLLDALTRRVGHLIGDLASQISSLRRAREADVLFGAADEVLSGSALLRSLGVLRTPVAAVFHHPPSRSWIGRRAARGYDLVFTLSSESRNALIGLGRDPERTILICWGPQVDFGPYAQPLGHDYVLSCGKSARDLDTLASAAVLADVPALIYAPRGWAAPANARALRVRHFPEMPPYAKVMEEMANASVVAIPLRSTDRMYGLSELNDAMALGKPVVMTRTPHLDLDLDRLGCGHLMEVGDVEGWRSVLTRLHNDPELRRAMGQKARDFAEREWNAVVCARQIVDGLETLTGSQLHLGGNAREAQAEVEPGAPRAIRTVSPPAPAVSA